MKTCSQDERRCFATPSYESSGRSKRRRQSDEDDEEDVEGDDEEDDYSFYGCDCNSPPFIKLPLVRTETLVTDLDPPPPPDQ